MAASIEDGALDFVIVGGGPTGVETAGAGRDDQYHHRGRVPRPAARRREVHLVDGGHALLKMFADKTHDYTAKVLEKNGSGSGSGRASG